MRRSVDDYLRHVLDEAAYLAAAGRGLDFAAFSADETLKRAFVRSLEVIGEAVKQVPEDFRARHPQIEWRAIAGMRDRLIHHYFGVDYLIVWDAATNNVPALAAEIEKLLATGPSPAGASADEGPPPL
jgi:uncharacterized protein with HEPN domain